MLPPTKRRRRSLGCGHAATSSAARDVRLTSSSSKGKKAGRVPQEELQEDIQRFVGQLMERTGLASEEVAGSGKLDPLATEALRRAVLYESAALDIATEPLPEVAALDMVVFLRLNRQVLADHWIPKVFGERGRPFLTAFEKAEEQFWPIADKVLSPSMKENLTRGIDDWRRKNPDLVWVEFVRLTDFAARSGTVAVAKEEEVNGMLASVKAATKEADEAILLGDRALFLADRLPFLLRHQVRLGAREVVGDSMGLVTSAAGLTEGVKNLEPVAARLPGVVTAAAEAVRQTRKLVEEAANVPTAGQVSRLDHTVEATNKLVTNTTALIGEVRSTSTKGPESVIGRTAELVDGTMRRALVYLVILSIVWWTGFVVAKRLARERRNSRLES
jgi:hypothetical protein